MVMRTEDITSVPSIAASLHQGSSQYRDIPVAQEDTPYTQHKTIKIGTTTKASGLIIKTAESNNTQYKCNFPSCSHQDRLYSKKQAISHIRSAHLKEKPYKCAW